MKLGQTPAYVGPYLPHAFPTCDVLLSPRPAKVALLLLMVHQAGDGKSAPMKRQSRWKHGPAECAVRRKRCKSSTSWRSEEHTYELQSLMRISYAVFCLKKKKNT